MLYPKTSGFQVISRTSGLIGLLIILLLVKPENGDCQTYEVYHKLISTAEEYYFLENNVDSALACYQRCFESFDFVFARDAVNALQIAHKENEPCDVFLITAFKAGVTPAVLASIPALTPFIEDSLPKLKLMHDYALYRSHYLERINVNCLNTTYRLGLIDQITKYQNKVQTPQLFKMALEYGLPGERNCGLEDWNIHAELDGRAADFLSLRDSISQKFGMSLGYYKLESTSLMTHIPVVIMLHDYCTFKDYEKDLHEAWLGGFIHPREIGNIYDNSLRGEDPVCIKVTVDKGIFGLNGPVPKRFLIPEKADLIRAKWGICSIETDRKKKEMEKSGFQFIWDYW